MSERVKEGGIEGTREWREGEREWREGEREGGREWVRDYIRVKEKGKKMYVLSLV